MLSKRKLGDKKHRFCPYSPITDVKKSLRIIENNELNVTLEDAIIPCNQNQDAVSVTTLFESNTSAFTRNTDSPASRESIQSFEQNLTIGLTNEESINSHNKLEDNLSVSILDSIFNTTFNHEKDIYEQSSNIKVKPVSSDLLSILDSSDSKTSTANSVASKNLSRHNTQQRLQQGETFFGLPLSVKNLVKHLKGIDSLYDWQKECLILPAIDAHSNLIYALPTSGGKTLVAEILMLKEILCKHKNVLFILPFVSIVQEKVWALSPFAVHLNFLIEEYAGGKGVLPPRKRRQKRSIYIATIEKGLMLVRSLIETNRLEEIGLVVIDELHLLGEPNRGTSLEVLLTNVMHCGKHIQIVGMSATIGNIKELAEFIKAEIFVRNFRPVELSEYIKIGPDLYSINYSSNQDDIFTFNRKLDFKYSPEAEKVDSDHLGGLIMEVIPKGSCLIFCPTKKNCENVASIVLRSILPKKLLEYRKSEKKALQDALNLECDGKSSLSELVEWGIAYHHAGLAIEERRLVEDAFRNGVLNVLCCTSTLAAGVNLPAQRVILRAPLVGKCFITLSMYKQMVGRAGRTGFGGHGDSIMICPAQYLEKVKSMISSPMESVNSHLWSSEGTHMRSFVLGSIASGIAVTRSKLRDLLNKSLLSIQAQRLGVNIKQELDKTIISLIKLSAIEVKNIPLITTNNVSIKMNETINSDHTEDTSVDESTKSCYEVSRDTELSVSKLGRAAVKGSFSLCHARWLYSDLKLAQQCLVLTDILHLLFLVTPYEVAENVRPDWITYKTVLENLSTESTYTVRQIGFSEYSVVRLVSRELPKNMPQRVFNRFYVTLILYDLWKQESLQDVSYKYGVTRGMVQLLLEQASSFCASVIKFCEELEEFWVFRDLLSGLASRLSHCCIQELVPLMELPNVKKNRAMQLYKAGFKTLKSIAKTDANILVDSIEHLPTRTAHQLIAAAKLLLLEKLENLKEQAIEYTDSDVFV